MVPNKLARSWLSWVAVGWLAVALVSEIAPRLFAQDILLADFEETNYVWLPGGVWTATGTCFGTGPVQGALPNQQSVDGCLGNGMVNSYLNSDSSTGTLVSPSFTIQRDYLQFLIGGGSYRGEGGYGGETRCNQPELA